LASDPGFILGSDPFCTAVQLAKIFGEAYQDKYFAEGSDQRKKMAWAVQYLINSAPAPVPDTFKNTCQTVLTNEAA
jgi:hypothetical protein